MSYPTYYEENKITNEQKDIAVNIVQAANYFDMFLMRFKHKFPSIGNGKNINKFFVRNSSYMFSKEVSDLIMRHISYFAIDEEVILSNGEMGIVRKHTDDPMLPIVETKDGTLINLKEHNGKIVISNMIDERSDEE